MLTQFHKFTPRRIMDKCLAQGHFICNCTGKREVFTPTFTAQIFPYGLRFELASLQSQACFFWLLDGHVVKTLCATRVALPTGALLALVDITHCMSNKFNFVLLSKQQFLSPPVQRYIADALRFMREHVILLQSAAFPLRVKISPAFYGLCHPKPLCHCPSL